MEFFILNQIYFFFSDRSPFDWSRLIHKWTSFSSDPASTFGIGFKGSYNSNMGCMVWSHRFYIRGSSWTSRRGNLFQLLLMTIKRRSGPQLWFSTYGKPNCLMWNGSFNFNLGYIIRTCQARYVLFYYSYVFSYLIQQ